MVDKYQESCGNHPRHRSLQQSFHFASSKNRASRNA
jgi:hypothetical protein